MRQRVTISFIEDDGDTSLEENRKFWLDYVTRNMSYWMEDSSDINVSVEPVAAGDESTSVDFRHSATAALMEFNRQKFIATLPPLPEFETIAQLRKYYGCDNGGAR